MRLLVRSSGVSRSTPPINNRRACADSHQIRLSHGACDAPPGRLPPHLHGVSRVRACSIRADQRAGCWKMQFISGLLASLTCIVLMTTGCSSASDDGGESRGNAQQGENCSTDLDCADERARCSPQHVCTGALTKGSYSQSCTMDTIAQCPGYLCLLPENGADGVCSYQCANNEMCAEGLCILLPGAGQVCLKPCDGNADCNDGYTCLRDPGGNGNVCWISG